MGKARPEGAGHGAHRRAVLAWRSASGSLLHVGDRDPCCRRCSRATRSTSAAVRSTAGRRSSFRPSRRRFSSRASRRSSACWSFNGLPMPYHPVFNVKRFREHALDRRASSCASSRPTRRSIAHATRAFLEGLGANEVNDVDALRRLWKRSASGSAARAGASCARWCRSRPLAGCRQDMHAGAALRPARSRATSSPTSGRSRPIIEGTVARGHLRDDKAFYTGKIGTALVDRAADAGDEGAARARPGALQHLLLAVPLADRRRQRHDRAARLQAAAVVLTTRGCGTCRSGYFYDVITNGFGQMQDYAAQVAAGRSLGDRRLHPRAAVQPERDHRRRSGGRPAALDGGAAPSREDRRGALMSEHDAAGGSAVRRRSTGCDSAP